MKYLRKFATEAEVFMTKTPNAVLVEDTKKVLYNIDSSGVYIQHIDGTLYRREDWIGKGFAQSEANGVAVIAEECAFVVATIKGSAEWADTPALVEGLPSLNNELAKKDFEGAKNTSLILAAGYETSAAKNCNDYIFPNGTRGYLPSLGELIVVERYSGKIDTALSTIGGSAFSSNYFWSSTQASASQAYLYSISGNKIYNFNKNASGYYYKPFAPLNL